MCFGPSEMSEMETIMYGDYDDRGMEEEYRPSRRREFEVDIERLNSDGDLSVSINEDGSTRVE